MKKILTVGCNYALIITLVCSIFFWQSSVEYKYDELNTTWYWTSESD